MVTAVFSISEIMNSNLTGAPSKIKQNSSNSKKELNSQKLNYLIEFIKINKQKELDEEWLSKVRTSISNKLNKINEHLYVIQNYHKDNNEEKGEIVFNKKTLNEFETKGFRGYKKFLLTGEISEEFDEENSDDDDDDENGIEIESDNDNNNV